MRKRVGGCPLRNRLGAVKNRAYRSSGTPAPEEAGSGDPALQREGCLHPVDGDRLSAIRQDQAILHYREMSGSGDPALQKRGRGTTKKARREK